MFKHGINVEFIANWHGISIAEAEAMGKEGMCRRHRTGVSSQLESVNKKVAMNVAGGRLNQELGV